MKIQNTEETLSRITPADRVLLLSHCLRPSQTCPGKFDKKGLVCPDDCSEDCVIRRCREVALKLGYKGVCIAAGGAMALRFIKEHTPRGVVAVACGKELEAGLEGVKGMVEGPEAMPAVSIIPLLSDGCVDTEVDEEQVLNAIALGYYPQPAEGGNSPG